MGKNGSYRFLGWGMAAFRGSLYFSKVCTISERAVTADDGVIFPASFESSFIMLEPIDLFPDLIQGL